MNSSQQVTGWPSIMSSQQFASAVWWWTDVTVGSRVCAFSQHLGFLSHRDPKLEHIHYAYFFLWFRQINSGGCFISFNLVFFKKKKSFESTHCTCTWFTHYADLRVPSWNLEGNLKNHFLKAFAVFFFLFFLKSWYLVVEGGWISSAQTWNVQLFSWK